MAIDMGVTESLAEAREQLLTVAEGDLEWLRVEWIKWFEEPFPHLVPTEKDELVDFIMINSDPIFAEGGLVDFVYEMEEMKILKETT